jgi:hypothetical protein
MGSQIIISFLSFSLPRILFFCSNFQSRQIPDIVTARTVRHWLKRGEGERKQIFRNIFLTKVTFKQPNTTLFLITKIMVEIHFCKHKHRMKLVTNFIDICG